MKIFAKFKIIVLTVVSTISTCTMPFILDSCHKKTSPPNIGFKKFSDAAEKATPFEIVSNATPKIWTRATAKTLSQNSTGFQVQENVSISIELIFTDNDFTKQNSFIILFKKQAYDLTKWITQQASDFNTYKAVAEQGGAIKVWDTIYNYYAINKKYLPNINFTTPQNINYKGNFTIDSANFIEDNKNHTIDLAVNIIQNTNVITDPAFNYKINIIATWTGCKFSISDWTTNYSFLNYSTTLFIFFNTIYGAKTLIIKSKTPNKVPVINSTKTFIDKTNQTINTTYTYRTATRPLDPLQRISFEAKMVIDTSQRVGLFGFHEMYGGKKSDHGIGDIHWLPPYKI